MVVLTFVTMVMLTIVANLLLKVNGMALPQEKFVFGLFNWVGLFGIAAFGLSAILYTIILTKLPLNLAQSLAVSQFVGVILASHFVLGEELPMVRVIGLLFIILGMVIVGFTINNS